MNLVIKMNEGKIYDMIWDNNCLSCTQNNCVRNIEAKSIFNDNNTQIYDNCFQKCKNEDKKNKIKKKYDPKFYITWYGTDKDNKQLKTYEKRKKKIRTDEEQSSDTSDEDLL